MYDKENLKKVIDKFIEQVSQEIKIDKLYLFGSYANGTPNKYSDIDLAIISQNFEGSRFFDRRKLNKYILSTSIDLEIHPFKTEDFDDDDPFVKEIIKTGVRII